MEKIPFRDILRERNFSRLWYGQIISSFGDRFYFFAIFSVVLGMKSVNTPGQQFASATLCGVMPGLLFAAAYGWIVDRFSRRWVMIWADLSRVLLTLSLIYIWTYSGSLTGVYVIIFLMGTLNGLFIPARQAALPQLISSDKLVPANALISTIGIIANMLGVPLAQFFVTIFNPAYCFVINAVGFVVSAWFVYSIDADLSPNSEQQGAKVQPVKESFFSHLTRGIQVVREQADIVPLLIAVTIFSVSGGIGLPTLVQHVVGNVSRETLEHLVTGLRDALHPWFPKLEIKEDALALGMIMAGLGVGMAIGIGLCGLLDRFGRLKGLPFMALAVYGLVLIGFAQTHHFVAAILGSMAIGLPAVLVLNSVEARIQNDVVNEDRGRVFALKNLCTATGFIIGLGCNVSPWALHELGTALIFEIVGTTALISGLISLAFMFMTEKRLFAIWTPHRAPSVAG